MTDLEMKMKIAEQLDSIVKSIRNGRDVEIVKTSSGISIKEVAKKRIM